MEPTTFRTSFTPECPCLTQYRTSEAIQNLIDQVFLWFDPDRLGEVEDLVRDHQGREPELYLETLETFASGSEAAQAAHRAVHGPWHPDWKRAHPNTLVKSSFFFHHRTGEKRLQPPACLPKQYVAWVAEQRKKPGPGGNVVGEGVSSQILEELERIRLHPLFEEFVEGEEVRKAEGIPEGPAGRDQHWRTEGLRISPKICPGGSSTVDLDEVRSSLIARIRATETSRPRAPANAGGLMPEEMCPKAVEIARAHRGIFVGGRGKVVPVNNAPRPLLAGETGIWTPQTGEEVLLVPGSTTKIEGDGMADWEKVTVMNLHDAGSQAEVSRNLLKRPPVSQAPDHRREPRGHGGGPRSSPGPASLKR
jgi:hypothetical protein